MTKPFMSFAHARLLDVVDELTDDHYRLLFHLADREAEQGAASVNDARELLGEDTGDLLLFHLRDLGLLRQGKRAMGDDFHLTAEAKVALQLVRDRQQDRGHRRRQSRTDLLRWLDSNTTPDPQSRVSLATFEGSADQLVYTPEEVAAAVNHLTSQKLISASHRGAVAARTVGDPNFQVWITEPGREFLDAGATGTSPTPAAGDSESASYIGGMHHTHHYNVQPVAGPTHHYYGPVVNTGNHAQVSVGDHNSQRQEHNVVEQVSAGYEQLVEVLVGLLENVDAYGLSAEDAEGLRDEVEIVRGEVINTQPDATPDRSRVTKAVRAIKGVLADTYASARLGANAAVRGESQQLLEQLFNGGLF